MVEPGRRVQAGQLPCCFLFCSIATGLALLYLFASLVPSRGEIRTRNNLTDTGKTRLSSQAHRKTPASFPRFPGPVFPCPTSLGRTQFLVRGSFLLGTIYHLVVSSSSFFPFLLTSRVPSCMFALSFPPCSRHLLPILTILCRPLLPSFHLARLSFSIALPFRQANGRQTARPNKPHRHQHHNQNQRRQTLPTATQHYHRYQRF